MSAAEKKKLLPIASMTTSEDHSRRVLRSNASNELIIAVVGHVGSGTTTISELLEDLLTEQQLRIPGTGEKKKFQVKRFKASEVITSWAEKQGIPVSKYPSDEIKRASDLQDLGDEMRKADHAAVARALIQNIHEWRNTQRQYPLGQEIQGPKLPDGQPRAYILDSVRHPAEIHLLRGVYQTAFAVIGVVCEEERRFRRLFGESRQKPGKFKNVGDTDGWKFIDRDRKAKEKYGQRVDDAFHLADFFLDNSPNKNLDNGKPNEDWGVPEQLKRFLRIVTHSEIERPTIEETAMYTAEGAKLRSACLSRQVGAALFDPAGNLISTGTNEVPRAGGGVYGQEYIEPLNGSRLDDRCAFNEKAGCSNTREQRKIEDEIIGELSAFFNENNAPAHAAIIDQKRNALLEKLHKTRLGGLIEFSRAVHAEMDALLSAARKRISPVGTRMFVTTFPCHSCARHIVAAGVDEVQYLEPYPKSKALELHKDSITTDKKDWVKPSQPGSQSDESRKVLFRPFTGVAPRLYTRAFLKDRNLKNERPETASLAIRNGVHLGNSDA